MYPEWVFTMVQRAESRSGLASALFSRVQLRILSLLFGQPDRAYQVTEAINLAGSGRGAVQRELERLTKAGILNRTLYRNHKLYQANRQSPVFEELRSLILKTVGLVEPLRDSLKAFRSKIDVAFVYGSIAKGADTANSDIDLLIIGDDLAYGDIFNALQKAEKTLHRPVSPNLMTRQEWRQRTSDKNPFIRKILQQPRLFIFGDDNELKGIG